MHFSVGNKEKMVVGLELKNTVYEAKTMSF